MPCNMPTAESNLSRSVESEGKYTHALFGPTNEFSFSHPTIWRIRNLVPAQTFAILETYSGSRIAIGQKRFYHYEILYMLAAIQYFYRKPANRKWKDFQIYIEKPLIARETTACNLYLWETHEFVQTSHIHFSRVNNRYEILFAASADKFLYRLSTRLKKRLLLDLL